MKQRNLYRIIVGILMLISGLVSIVLASGEYVIGSILLVGGIAFLLVGITRHFRDGESPESDERSKKIGAYRVVIWLADRTLLHVCSILAGLPEFLKARNTGCTRTFDRSACPFSQSVPDLPVPERRYRITDFGVHQQCRQELKNTVPASL